MNRKEKFNQVEVVKKALIRSGLIDKVTIGAYLIENYVGKKTLHIKCTWDETFKGFSNSRYCVRYSNSSGRLSLCQAYKESIKRSALVYGR